MSILTIDTNAECNLNCEYCYQELDGISLSKEDIFRILTETPSASIVEIGGGEPFLRADIADLIKDIISQGKMAHVSTNATIIPESIRTIDAEVRRHAVMQISLPAGTRTIYEEVTGHDYFDTVLGNAEELSHLYTTVFNAAIYKKNLGEVEQILEIGYSLGIPTRVSLVMPKGKGKDVELLSAADINKLRGLLLIEKIGHQGLVESPLLHQNSCPALESAYGISALAGKCPAQKGNKLYYDPRGARQACEFMIH